MRLSVFGLGYVGCVTAACFAKLGHDVIGVDVNERKVAQLRQGETPIKEEGLSDLIREAIENKRFTATNDKSFAIQNSDISFVCVRTPSLENGELDTSAIEEVAGYFAEPLSKKDKLHVIVIRSTVPPSTISILEDKLKEKKLVKGKNFVVAFNPEFLREGSAVKDFFSPPYIVIGCDDNGASDLIASVYNGINASVCKVSTKTAEIIKFVNNSWHALEISFVNEISSICKKLGIDSKELMDLFSSDTKLNLSAYYLKPNMGYGGSCLPKDLQALKKTAVKSDINCPVLNSIAESNIQQIKRSYNLIKQEAEKRNKKEIGIFGISFKPGSDDIRGSPILYIIERLRCDGFSVKVYDPIVKKEQIENIRNSYREVIYDPLLSALMDIKNFKEILDDVEGMLVPLDEMLDCDIIVLNAKMEQNILENLKKSQVIINTRAIIPIDNKEKIKARYIEVW